MTMPPLLMLAEGRKPRPRKAQSPKMKEIVLHMQVASLLRDFGTPGWMWSHFPAGEARDARAGAKLKRMGTKPGWPDLILISPAGVFHGLELKRQGGWLSGPQQQFQSWAAARGVAYSVADSLHLAVAALGHWGAVDLNGLSHAPPLSPEKTRPMDIQNPEKLEISQ